MKRVAFVSFTDKKYNLFSVNKGMLYIATVLRDNGYHTKVFQRSILRFSPAEAELYNSVPKFIDKVLEFKPDIIGITFTESNTVKDNIKYISMIREKDKNVKIVVGGPHITATMGEIFAYANINFAFYGEAERSFLEFMKKYPRYKGVKGLIYKDDGRIVINPSAEPIRDMDSLPFPDYRLVYGINGVENKLLINYIVFSRGCPYSCNFCYSHRVFMNNPKQKKVRFRSPKSIVDEIEFNIGLNGIPKISVGSESFTANRKWAIAVCNEIIDRNLKLTLYANTRYDLLDDELLKILKKAGFLVLHLGVESGSKRVVDMYNKKYSATFDINDYTTMNQLIMKNGIIPRSYIMMGNPFETFIDALKTLKLMLKRGVIYYPQPFDPYPGTEWYERGVKEGFVESGWYLRKETTLNDNVNRLHGLLINAIIRLRNAPFFRRYNNSGCA